MRLRHLRRRFQHPDLFEWAAEQERLPIDLKVAWIARRCRVSQKIAFVIAEHAGLLRGDH